MATKIEMKMIPTTIAKSTTKHSSTNLGVTSLRLLVAVGLSASLLTGLSGCSILEPYKAPLTQGTIISQENMALIQEGLTKTQARQLFGPPLGENPFNPRSWSYAYYSSDKTLHTNAVKRLDITFDEDDMIQSWEISDKPLEIKR